MPILPFRKGNTSPAPTGSIGQLLDGYSIEVMPRTAAKIEDFRAVLPRGTRVYIAHIEGTAIDDMVATARRLRAEGFAVMPHIPARLIRNRAELASWLDRYRSEAEVEEALVLAGGPRKPQGAFESAMELLDTGLFEASGFGRLHVAGHPEGNRDIDPDGGRANVDAALAWKQRYAQTTSAQMAIVTQFAFDAAGIARWVGSLRSAGITLPVHLGIAGPAKLQTLLKFSIACGVGPSLSVLQKRAKDLTKLLVPFEPDDVLESLAAETSRAGERLVEQIHIFPLGGIRAAADYAARKIAESASYGGQTGAPAP